MHFVILISLFALSLCSMEAYKGNIFSLEDKIESACKEFLDDDGYHDEPVINEQKNICKNLINGTGRAFNTSIVRHKNKYLLSTRIAVGKSLIIPGTKSFWWSNWCSDDWQGFTLYFLMDEGFKKLKLPFLL